MWKVKTYWSVMWPYFIAGPNIRMPLHLAYTQRRMERWVFCATLEAEKRFSCAFFDVGGERSIRFPEGLGRTELHCWSRKAIMSSIRSKVCTRPPAMARFAARSFSCHSGVQK